MSDPSIAPRKRIHEGPGFRIPASGFRIPTFWIPELIHTIVDSGFHTIVDSGFQAIVDSGFQSSGFRIPTANICWIPDSLTWGDIKSKSADLLDYICNTNADMFAFTETWLTERDVAAKLEIIPPSYKFVHQPHTSGRRGGGTGLLYKDSI